MYRLQWDRDTERLFGAGVSKGVLYVKKDTSNPGDLSEYEHGIPWNGLSSVSTSHDGGSFNYMFADNRKWNRVSLDSYFKGTIQAYNWPNEFVLCEGKRFTTNGTVINGQKQKSFGLCYRTEIGDDTATDASRGYAIHVIYDMTIIPAVFDYNTISDSIDILQASWDFITVPVEVDGYKPFSEIIINSMDIPSENLQAVEDVLYGSDDSYAHLPNPEELLRIAYNGEWEPDYGTIRIRPLSISSNGVYNTEYMEAFGPVTVSVPTDVSVSILSVSFNGTYIPGSNEAFGPVIVSVPGISVSRLVVNSNGIYTPGNMEAFGPVIVNVSGSISVSALSVSSNGTYTPTANHAFGPVVVSVPEISVSALSVSSNGTYAPTANHAFGPVVVSVPEISVSALSVSLNGTYTPTANHAFGPVVVNVPGVNVVSISINQNGIYNAPTGTAYSPITVNVSGGGGSTDIEDALITRGISGTYENIRISKVGSYAFAGCSNLVSISLPAASYGGRVYTGAFEYCERLSDLFLPFSNISMIMDYAFYKCANLVSVVSFSACKSIANSAFGYCSSLSFVSFSTCTNIGYYTFQYCSALTSVNFPECNIIGGYAFQYCSSLISVSFPACSIIYHSAFQSCISLTSVNFPACSIISDSAFDKCYGLINTNFANCTKINPCAFSRCSSLTSVNFPACESIGNYAFISCSSLVSISFPVCTWIGYGAFSSCSKLSSAYFPECLTLSGNAFVNCIHLSYASFPKCSTIGTEAFRACEGLFSLYFLGSSLCSLTNKNAFVSTPMSVSVGGVYGSIYVPQSLLASYKVANNWSFYSSRFVGV